MTPPNTWKDALTDQMDPAWSEEIDLFEGQMKLRRQGRLEEKVFAETRLRRGAYGQRYDNGQRSGRRSRNPAVGLPRAVETPRAQTPSGTRRACSGSRSPMAA